jgi:hypothetical protein
MSYAVVTPKARREWHERMEEYSKSEEAKLEAQRRTDLAKRAAASPLHVSKRKKKR